MPQLRTFFDRFDALDWGDMHYWWLDKPAAALRDWLYARVLDRAQVLLQAVEMPAAMAEALLPPEDTDAVGSWAHMFVVLRRAGYDPAALTVEEALLLLSYELDKSLAAPHHYDSGRTEVGQ